MDYKEGESMDIELIPDEPQGCSICRRCGKHFYGRAKEELCFACWLLEHPPFDKPLDLPKGAGGFDFYAMPNTITPLTRQDLLDYLTECPRDRPIWFDVMHNSATPPVNGIGVVQSFQDYHMSKGWSDIGYHFVITPDGQLYLGRNLVYQGAHAFAEGNRGSMGYCLVGDFTGDAFPTAEQIDSAGFLARACGAAFGYSDHSGHRFVVDPSIPSHATSCPGLNVSLEMIHSWTSGEGPQPEEEEDMERSVFGPGTVVRCGVIDTSNGDYWIKMRSPEHRTGEGTVSFSSIADAVPFDLEAEDSIPVVGTKGRVPPGETDVVVKSSVPVIVTVQQSK